MGALTWLCLWTAVAAAEEGLVVRIIGVRDTRGQVLVAVFDRSQTWLADGRAVASTRIPASPGPLEVRFPGLVAGEYAVSVVHDENKNGDLDMRWFPVPGPIEGAGVSNDAVAVMGPPSWAKSRFLFSGSGRIQIAMRY